ncbi:hypothetical protein AHR24_22895 [Salmonella enterica subsp. diarizonae]|nr:hypothetical protein [Salmonella enterica subsp. diarizonae]EDB6599580.1 hypothetical protein [Salmonella enterica subsp. diarizonae]
MYCLLRSYSYNNKKTKGKYIWSNQHCSVFIFALSAQNVNFKCQKNALNNIYYCLVLIIKH